MCASDESFVRCVLTIARSYGTDADGTDYWLMRNSWGTCVGCIPQLSHFFETEFVVVVLSHLLSTLVFHTHAPLRSYWGENGWARIKSGVNTLGVETNPCDWAVPA